MIEGFERKVYGTPDLLADMRYLLDPGQRHARRSLRGKALRRAGETHYCIDNCTTALKLQ